MTQATPRSHNSTVPVTNLSELGEFLSKFDNKNDLEVDNSNFNTQDNQSSTYNIKDFNDIN